MILCDSVTLCEILFGQYSSTAIFRLNRIRALVGVPHGADGLTVVAVVVILDEVARIEVEVPRIVRIDRIRRRGPVAAVQAGVVEVRVVAPAGSRKEDAPVRISPRARHQSPVNAVCSDPRGGAVVDECVELRVRRHSPRGAEMRRRRIVRRHEIASRVDPTLRLKNQISFVVGWTRR